MKSSSRFRVRIPSSGSVLAWAPSKGACAAIAPPPLAGRAFRSNATQSNPTHRRCQRLLTPSQLLMGMQTPCMARRIVAMRATQPSPFDFAIVRWQAIMPQRDNTQHGHAAIRCRFNLPSVVAITAARRASYGRHPMQVGSPAATP